MNENDSVRYCEIDCAYRLNCLSPSTSLKVTAEPPKTSPPLVTPTLTGGRPSRNSFSNVPFFRLFVGDERVRQRRLEVDDRAGRAEVGRGRGDDRIAALERVQLVVALVVADEGDLRLVVGLVQHDRADVAGHRVGVLPQLAVLQVERPDVVDVAVARDVRIDRLRSDRSRWTRRRACPRPRTARPRRRACRT
mgnify:CR=1 FL=1